jgi:hypothetical protein
MQNMHMCTNATHTVTVSLPSVTDFATRFPHYGPKASNDGAHFFELVMRPESFIDASALTRCLKVPAVCAIADQASALAGGEISGPDKQFLGALICTLMEHNGFTKTGRKGSVPQQGWNRGEIYAQAES